MEQRLQEADFGCSWLHAEQRTRVTAWRSMRCIDFGGTADESYFSSWHMRQGNISPQHGATNQTRREG